MAVQTKQAPRQGPVTSRSPLIDALSKVGNPLNSRLLRSPLHRLASGRLVLITVRGRKTGCAYTTPVEYWRTGDAINILSRRHRRWWHNLRGGGPVKLRLQGRDVTGWGEVTEDSIDVAGVLRRRWPKLAGAKLAARAEGLVAVRIRLDQ